jgi:flagellar biosynthesis protein FlhF
MTNKRLLTEEELHSLLRTDTARRQSTDTKSTSSSNREQDLVLNTIQAELRQLRSLMASRINLGTVGGPNASPLKSRILERLTGQGFHTAVCDKLLTGLVLSPDENTAWQQVLISLETQLPIHQDNILDHNGILAFVGPTGSGKTTLIAKLATQFVQKHNAQEIGLITTDNYSVSGRDQLSIYGRILDIPVHRVNNSSDLTEALTHLNGKRLILIDTPGLSQRAPDFLSKINILLNSPRPIKSLLTLAATTHELILEEIISAFNHSALSGACITKIDEAPFIGHIVSACIDNQLPIAALTDGQHIPSNLKIATLKNVLALSLKKTFYHQHSFSTDSKQSSSSTQPAEAIC